MSRIIKLSLGLAGTLLMASAAQAGMPAHTTCVVTPPPPPSCTSCDGPKTGHSTLPPLSSYFDHQARCGSTYKPAPKVVHHAPPIPTYKHRVPRYHPKKPCVVIVKETTTHCRTVIKKVHRPVVHPPKVYPPIVRPPVVHPPVIYPPVVHRPRYVRVVRPIVPVPYPVPVPVPYTVYAPCPTQRCQPVRHYSRYGG